MNGIRADGESPGLWRSMILGQLFDLPIEVRCTLLLLHAPDGFERAVEALQLIGAPLCVDARRLAWAVAYNMDALAKAIVQGPVVGRMNWALQNKWTRDTPWDDVWRAMTKPLATGDVKRPSTLLSELALSVACENRNDWQPSSAQPIDSVAAQRSFRCVYDAYESMVLGACVNLENRDGNHRLIAHEAWSRVYATYWSSQAAKRFEGFARLSTLLCSVARRLAVDEYRKRELLVPLDENRIAVEGARFTRFSIANSDPVAILASDQLYLRAEECLNRLPPKRRIYAKMVWIRQMSARQVARASRVSEAAISEHLKLARSAVGNCLKELGFQVPI